MNHRKFYILSTLILTVHTLILSMDPNGDRLWDSGKMIPDASPKPAHDAYFDLHKLIISPEIHTAPLQSVLEKVRGLLEIYPRYISIRQDGKTVLQLLAELLLNQNLTTQARANLEGLEKFLQALSPSSQSNSSAKQSLNFT